jgi:hypothetical protein|tara:strand:+ start:201 stop:311 length:111 start_codon:yes stop_codon:yes gene_type:complete
LSLKFGDLNEIKFVHKQRLQKKEQLSLTREKKDTKK